MWGTRFGTELWESLTRATRRDEIQKVKVEYEMSNKCLPIRSYLLLYCIVLNTIDRLN